MRRETIVIEGEINGLKFEKNVDLLVGEEEEVERAICRFFESTAESFTELMIEQGWKNSSWTYASKDQYYVLQ
ncbi:hypothetical protein U0355_11325 [Salimicrobium sp. PL1-032A]|uniref:hypothetical protein n=1 Tax=Salimicrobium sp. PL1-032A TaxID=3095364 RepID=UPI0032604A5E